MELKNGFDRLDRLTAKGPNHRDFVEPKVQDLWRTALRANFTSDELTSLKVIKINIEIINLLICVTAERIVL